MPEKKTTNRINPLFKAGLEFQNFFKNLNWPFCFIGGLVVIRWGEIRMTQDIDLCLSCGFGNEENYIRQLLEKYSSRVENATDFALKNRVLLLYSSEGVPVDISLSGLPFEEKMIKRATPFIFSPKCSLITCSAEDLIVLKSFANRTKDWMDVENILIRQSKNLDTKYIIQELFPLCELKEDLEIVDNLKRLFKALIK